MSAEVMHISSKCRQLVEVKLRLISFMSIIFVRQLPIFIQTLETPVHYHIHSDYFCKSYQCFFKNKPLLCLHSCFVNTILTLYISLGRHSYQFLQLQYCLNAPWPHKYRHIITHHLHHHYCYNSARGPSICRYIYIEPYSLFVYILINILQHN